MSLSQLLMQGWIALVPLFICSVLLIAVILERIWAYSSMGKIPKELMRRVEGLFARGDTSTALELLEDHESPFVRIVKVALSMENPSDEEITDLLTLACDSEVSSAGRPLPILGTIGNIAPFIGLFGTVIGIMGAFTHISLSGSAGFTTVSADISFALIATAVGLGVGIIAVIANNWCNAWVESFRLNLERFATVWAYNLRNSRTEVELIEEPVA